MITLRNVSKSFGAQTLFDDISLQVNDRDRFSLVGPNGAGKSTLFKTIMGKEEVDSGDVVIRGGVRFGYLPQETPSLSGKTLLKEVLENRPLDGRIEANAKKVLMGLGFRISDFERSVKEFSGGWQMRAMIAKLLVEEPDLLMLDEPTNHLDLESLLWFQNYLRSYQGALFIISHDREFINSTVDRIVELRDTKLYVYRGTYEKYLDQKKHEEEILLKNHKRQQKEIKEIETYINRFRAKASLAASVQSKIKYLAKMEKIKLPPEQKTVGFQFPQPPRAGHNVLVLDNIRQSYDGKTMIYDGLDLTLECGQKIALVGPNGAGKSTLLKLLAGELNFQSGERKLGLNVEVGYFSQHRDQMFDMNRTVFQEACDSDRAHSETTIRTVLGSFLFGGDAVYKKVSVLSGGEKSRLGLAKILLDPPNLLLMDEPTTHLDMASVDILIQALKEFEGTFCFISHDVYFIRQLATRIIHINRGKISTYPGSYDYFLRRMSQMEGEEGDLFRSESSIEKQTHSQSPSGKKSKDKTHENKKGGKKTKDQKRREAEERNARYREKKHDQEKDNQRSMALKKEEELLEKMADPNTHQNPETIKKLTHQLTEIRKTIQRLK